MSQSSACLFCASPLFPPPFTLPSLAEFGRGFSSIDGRTDGSEGEEKCEMPHEIRRQRKLHQWVREEESEKDEGNEGTKKEARE
mmetsp:Transcript_46380/g.91511  ORF Transcript_46380/g.91511 Transcript_46380/m.91511 type:complete len:84 (+) Transcript_46380:398-649(+)